MVASRIKNNIFEGRRFLISAVLASVVLLFADQTSLVLWSPIYFYNTGDFLWNLFVSTSFLNVLVTLYGLTGGICLQATADLVDPFGAISRKLKEARANPFSDQQISANLLATLVAAGAYCLATILVQIHVSTAYNNKMLAAILMLAILISLLPVALAVYQLVSHLTEHVVGPIERIFPKRVLQIEIVSVFLFFILLVILFFVKNPYILEAIDFRPFGGIALFIVAQILIYILLRHPVVLPAFKSAFFHLAVFTWLILASFMTVATINNYSSFPQTATVLANHSMYVKHVINGVQTLVDRDSDGFSPLLNGGDCNDYDSGINPLARDIPENGIDEDCLNGDLKLISSKYKNPPSETLQQKIAELQGDYNIILISIDALRVDHLGYMGYSRDTSPEIDAIAEDSTIFTRAYSQAPNTPQSIPSFITGTYPSQIKWNKYSNFPKILSETETLTERLKGHGYQVAGIFSHWFFEKRNLKRSSDVWDNRAFRTRGHSESNSTDDLVTDNAIENLKKMSRNEKPIFMWLHYFDPHFLYKRHKGINFGKKQIDLYDGEIRYSSSQVGRFIDYFKTTPLYDNSVIFIIADHGEEFGDHGRKWHGSHIYEEAIRVPLIVHSPKLPTGKFTKPVGIINVTPTIYDLVGIDPKETQAQGESLMQAILEPETISKTVVYTEKLKVPTFPWSMQAIITEDWKLIYRPNEQSFELFNLLEDPHENENLYTKSPDKAKDMVDLFTQVRATQIDRED